MGFLNPALLALGIAVAVPLILHLFHRHHGPRMVFPALRYLRRAEKESARKVRLRQILLLLLRVLAILLLAFAAARPFVRTGGVTHEPTAVVIILDNSMSSGTVIDEQRVIDVLKQRALDALEQGEPEDWFWLLRAGAPEEPAYPGDAAATAARVRDTEPTASSANIVAAVERARAILEAGANGRAAEIHLLSDMQASNIAGAAARGGSDIPVIAWMPSHDMPSNGAVTDVEIGGGIAPAANERSSITAVVGGDAADTVNVRLMIDGRLAAAARATAGGAAVLNLPPLRQGVMTGWVEMDADALRADNRRYFATEVAAPPVVTLAAPIPFVAEALEALESAGRIRRGGGGANVVIAQGAAANASAGTLVVLPPASPLEIQAVNRRLATLGIPWSYALQQSPGEATFALADSADAVLRTLQSARLRNVYRLLPGNGAEGDTVLLRLRDGGAWAVRGERAGGARYVLVASPFTEAASSIPTSAAMLPLLDRILTTWSRAGSGTEQARTGQTIALPPGTTAVLRPDSVEEPVGGSFVVPSAAGIYRVLAGDSVTAAFAVNAPALESFLQRGDAGRLKGALPEWEVITADDESEWMRDVYRQRLGRELWRPLLLALLVLLAVEALVAATGGLRRHDGVTGEPH